MNDLLGVVLAGGRSERMGRDKADVRLGGSRLLDLVVGALHAAGLAVVLAGPRKDEAAILTVPDGPGSGPVAGLVGAFTAYPGATLFVVAVDQPLLRPDTVAGLLALDGDVVVPLDRWGPQVTCAVYRPAAASLAAAVLASERASLLAVLEQSPGARLVDEETWRGWGEDGRSWLSIDTPGDLEVAERLIADG